MEGDNKRVGDMCERERIQRKERDRGGSYLQDTCIMTIP